MRGARQPCAVQFSMSAPSSMAPVVHIGRAWEECLWHFGPFTNGSSSMAQQGVDGVAQASSWWRRASRTSPNTPRASSRGPRHCGTCCAARGPAPLPLLLLPSFPRYLVECASAAWSARPRELRNALLCFVTLCAECARRVTPRCRYTLVAGLQSTLPTAQASQLSPAGAHVERAHVALEAVCAHFGNWSQRRTAPQPALGSCVNSMRCETLVDCSNRHHRRYRFSRFPRMVVF